MSLRVLEIKPSSRKLETSMSGGRPVRKESRECANQDMTKPPKPNSKREANKNVAKPFKSKLRYHLNWRTATTAARMHVEGQMMSRFSLHKHL